MASALVDEILQDMELLGRDVLAFHHPLEDLQIGLRHLRTFLLFARKWHNHVRSKSDENTSRSSLMKMGSFLNRLEYSLIENGESFHILCLTQKNDILHIEWDLLDMAIKLKNCIYSFREGITESYITLSEYHPLQSKDQSLEFIDSLQVNMADVRYRCRFDEHPIEVESLQEKLVFFKNFIRFAHLRGFEHLLLQFLFTHLRMVGVNAARLCHDWTFLPYKDKTLLRGEFQLKFSDLKTRLVDPHIRERYVQALSASKSFGSSRILTLGADRHVLGDFVDSLLYNILEALTEKHTYMVSLKDQVPMLYEGLIFFRTILTNHLEKIVELHEKVKDLIGAAVNEAAIVTCSLPVHKLEDASAKEMDSALHNFLEKMTLIKPITSSSIFPRTNGHDFVDFSLENLKELTSCKADSIAYAKDQIQRVQEDLASLRSSFLENNLDQRNRDGKLQSLWSRAAEVASKTWFVIESLVVGDNRDGSTLKFNLIKEEINLIKTEAMRIDDNQYSSEAQNATDAFSPSTSQGSATTINKMEVSLDDEVRTITGEIIGGPKRLEIISIVGMPGIGKTKLARSVYENPSVRNLFHARAWCIISQLYEKKDLLLQILGSIDRDFSDDNYSKKDEFELEEKLKKYLLRRRYLIVLDDVWDIDAWSGLARLFPDNVNSSRILLTSRCSDLAKKINPTREPHPLRLLTDEESWHLLQEKLSHKEVSLDDEVRTITGEIIGGPKQLEIISIVGMPGVGKTKLARSVYENPSVRNLFRARAWCIISQLYEKKDLLLQILGSIDRYFSEDNYSKKDEFELEEKLKKCLLRRRYLIVLDDVWDIDAWSGLARLFPDNANSSRILLTSRCSDLAKMINPTREPHPLRLPTDKKSWHLLQEKLSHKEGYPLNLGMKIAKNCKGLPLTIVIAAGILANLEQDGWEKVAERLSLSDLPIIDQCMDMLEVSYDTLPENLKLCFLYFGAFREDEEIPCKRVIWLWKAEGFVKKCEAKSLEDVANDYMNDLISRNLVTVSKKRSIGGAKTCRIHDLLHKFCVIKAKKEKFMSVLSGHDELFTFHGQRDLQRLCIHSTSEDLEESWLFYPSVRSFLFFADGKYSYHFKHRHISFIFHFFKLLTVLDLTNINLGNTFPRQIALLVQLRYLAIHGHSISIPPAVANLSNLETLLVYACRVFLPDTIWNLSKLRVLQSNGLISLNSGLTSSNLYNLDTFSTVYVSYRQLEKIMRKLPNARKLKCRFLDESGESNADCKSIVEIDWLSQLESLHLNLYGIKMGCIGFRFPLNIKKLALSCSHSSIIPKGGELPNLVVLKLDLIDFEGDTWDMKEEWEFPNLKLLEMNSLTIVRWTGSVDVDHFPCLEKLVVHNCMELEEVPSCFGEIPTLEMIEVRHCGNFAVSLFQKIKEEQKYWGNDMLVLIEN